MDLLEELRWRGMLHDAMPGTAEHLAAQQPVSGYIGFDPTGVSLHIGSLATIMLLVHLQRAGHRPVALVGGATGMIGDPSGKSAERNLLDEDTLRRNQAGIKAQLEKFLDFTPGPNAAVVVNNYDWFKDFGFLDFLREVGKHLTVNYMMAKDSVKRRLGTTEGDEQRADGLSFTEFSYQLLQGYDFLHLFRTLNCTLQMGGSDQWGNITTGTELIRRLGPADAKAYALTTPLITKADGSKFGKTEGGNVWLDPAMTSPYQFYQFFLNAADEDAPRLIRVFTLLPQAEIEALEAEHTQAPHLRLLQKALAKDVTIRVHSEAAYETALAASQVLFGGGELSSLDEATLLDVFAGVPQLEVSHALLSEANVVTLLSEATNGVIFPSKGEARKMMQSGGVSLNRQKVAPEQLALDVPLLLDKYLVAQKGKKNYFLIKLA
ncbi:tyrosyl-tRNA synthetase [Hymenobacter daecheongensis DSM 21074]|uniref:Tyrosine--tRNA ligase n=1 Tax=Hymenobacter daecheongensis DSM 21074 TaxID=1121955 RepID=A0A1M6K670_9BACT|nr:tyrosine--tRNA ligase [Hymenobacter daecheongensis]SHJ54461.1 tyrosyl-tRNA synthetase [Hymenobacter daecheongensis DSM 21074]